MFSQTQTGSTQGQATLVIEDFSFQQVAREWDTLNLIYPGEYHNSSQQVDEYLMLEQTANQLINVTSIGQTHLGLDIYSIIVTNELNTQQKPKMVIVSNHHARELVTDEMALRFVLMLINGYGNDPFITNMLDNLEIHIIPNINADSRDFVIADSNNPWLRKNLVPFDDDGDGTADEDGPEDVNGDGKVSCYDVFLKSSPSDTDPNYQRSIYECTYFEGIDNDGDGLINEDHSGYTDLNRNYDAGWGIGSETEDARSQVYAGTQPFSEVETQVVRDYLLDHKFTWGTSLHTGINATLFPSTYEGFRLPIYGTLVNDLLGVLPASFGNWINGGLNEGASLFQSGVFGLWRSWMEDELLTRAPFTFELYNNATTGVDRPETYIVTVDNSTHKIIEFNGIFEFFNPNRNVIDSLFEDVEPAFRYMMETTPLLEVIVDGKLDGSDVILNITLTNPSYRFETDEIHLLDGTEERTLMSSLSPNTNDISSIKIIGIFTGSKIIQLIKIGNEYEGYQEFILKIGFSTETTTNSESNFTILQTLLILVPTLAFLKRYKFDNAAMRKSSFR